MTVNLRDRLSVELDSAVDVTEGLVTDVVVRGRARLRTRRVSIALAAAAVAVGTTWTGVSLTNHDKAQSLVADGQSSSRSTTATETSLVRANWDALLLTYFDSALPEGFAPLTQNRGGDTGKVPEFITDGGNGPVHLAATVYIAAGLPPQSCADTNAQECRTVATGRGGSATILINRFPGQPKAPVASEVFVTEGGTQTIINVIEETPGQSQFSVADLAGLATTSEFAKVIEFATKNAEPLRAYGTEYPY
ncbi:hypothetical protein FB382_003761 [Nocardioides ginsengisegetis]|uniref:Uncharacterized protein n=1 Tax=Nocardioides ginsengisegetis TaxID=661491 RepID=A0A7W3PB51_9ACTN|nr:hypothetical protein [Nocardioides ginsengisegetis]MBA8805470.1 hypothetical protein [Nocardioides ginsengisegetis]